MLQASQAISRRREQPFLDQRRAYTPASPPPIAARLSMTQIAWTGWGITSWPRRDEQRLASHIGADAADELLPQLHALEDDIYAGNARDVAPDLATMGRPAAEDFRRLHPEVSDDAVQALAWCYTFDYK
jgi:hypothetical protein